MSNTLLISIGLFFLLFTWFYFYTVVAWLSALCAGVVSMVFAVIFYKLSSISNKKELSKKQKQEKTALSTYLALNECDFFKQIYIKSGYAVEEIENDFIATKQEKILICQRFEIEQLSPTKVAGCIKLSKKVEANKVVIFCSTASAQTLSFVKANQNICVIVLLEEVYTLLKTHNMLPELDKKIKITQKNALLCNLFTRTKARFYFISSVGLVATSFLSFFPIYALISSTILFLMGLYAKFNKKYNYYESYPLNLT
ncbi:MAG: hypothetical protein RR248_05895 [Clostridia bacterium]